MQSLIGVGGSLAGAAVGVFLGARLTDRQQKRSALVAKRENVRAASADLLTAAAELQGVVAAHRQEWFSPRGQAMALSGIAVRVAPLLPQLVKNENLGGIPDFSNVFDFAWDLNRRQMETVNLRALPAITRLHAATVRVIAVADEPLRAAALEVMERTVDVARSTSARKRERSRAERRLTEAVARLGELAGFKEGSE